MSLHVFCATVDTGDNCPTRRNSNQNDADGDGVGNSCDNCRYHPNREQDPKDLERFGSLCTTRPAYLMGEDDDDDMFTDSDKKGVAAEIMKKLLDMYYSN